MKQIQGQISLYDIFPELMSTYEPFICDICRYNGVCGCCGYDKDDDYCVLGDKYEPIIEN